MTTPDAHYWSPVGDTIHSSDGATATRSTQITMKWLSNTKKLRLIRLFLVFFAVSLTTLYLFFIDWSLRDVSPALVVSLFLPLIVLMGVVRRTQLRIANLQIAQVNGWLFIPGMTESPFSKVDSIFPHFFTMGDSPHFIDQFWGKVQGEHVQSSFWLATFSYIYGTGKQRRTVHETVVIFELEKPVVTDVVIEPEDMGTIIGNVFFKRDIELESNEFNKLFHVHTGDRNSANAKDVFFVLNPAAMSALLDFRNKYGPFFMHFRGNMLAVRLFKHPLVKLRHTNFFRSPTIDERDVRELQDVLKTLVTMGNEIAFRLD